LNTCGHSPYLTSSLLTIAAGPRQHIHSGVQVPWDSRLYFTVRHQLVWTPFCGFFRSARQILEQYFD
jgi:hypothetical protein